MIKTKFKGVGHTPLSNPMASSICGRVTSKDIVSGHKAAHIKNLGYTNFRTDRPGKVSIKGGQK